MYYNRCIKFDVFRALVMKIQVFWGYDTVWRHKKLLMLQKNLLPISSGSVKSKKNVFELHRPSRWWRQATLKCQDILQTDTVTYPRRLEYSSATDMFTCCPI